MTHHPFRLATLAIALTLGLTASGQAQAADNQSKVIDRVITQVIRPGFDAFARSTATLAASTHDLCEAPDAARFTATRAAFADVIDSWSRVEFIRLGPLANANRLERVMFWPDRRGRGLAQVQEAIRTKDESVTDVASLTDKSVALQGLPALDFVLSGTGSEDIASGADPVRCRFAEAIAANVAGIATEFSTAWNDPEGFSKLWLEPQPLNPLFRNGNEQLSRLLHMMGDGVELMHVQRVAPVIEESRKNMKPKAALFWRSGNYGRTLRGNIEGIESLYQAARLQDMAKPGDVRRLDGTAFSLNEAKNAFADLPDDIAALKKDEAAYQRLVYGDVVLTRLTDNFKDTIPVMFGLNSGFSTLDGD